MDCQKILPLIMEYCDGELNIAEAKLVENHLAVCASCKQEFELLRRTASLISKIPEVDPPQHLLQQINAVTVCKRSFYLNLHEYLSQKLCLSRRYRAWIAAGVTVVGLIIALLVYRPDFTLHPSSIESVNPPSAVVTQPSQPEVKVVETNPTASASNPAPVVVADKRYTRPMYLRRIKRKTTDIMAVKSVDSSPKSAVVTKPDSLEDPEEVAGEADELNLDFGSEETVVYNQENSSVTKEVEQTNAEIVKISRPIDNEIEAKLKKQAEDLERWRVKLASSSRKDLAPMDASGNRVYSVDLATISF
jgi:hypothetical protein